MQRTRCALVVGMVGAFVGCWGPTNPCDANPCQHGTCDPRTGSSFTCQCEVGWLGDACDSAIDCQSPPAVADANPPLISGGVAGGSTTTYGATADYVCVPGFARNGTDSTCDINGSWTVPPVCTLVSCGAAPAVTNASAPLVTGGADGGTYGATAAYTCVTGYTKIGADPTCQLDGTWEAAPVCNAISCPAPPSVTNAGAPTVSGGVSGGSSTTYGATAAYSCNSTYFQNGPNPTCQLNGSWSVAPSCTSAPLFCDVVYRLHNGSTGLSRYHNIKTGTGARNVQEATGVNSMTATGMADGGTPFTTGAFPGGFVRLRFPANGAGTAPVAGKVQVIEAYNPIEFSYTPVAGATISTDVDYSAGMLSLTSAGCPASYTDCVGSPVTLSRACAPVAEGTLSGTVLALNGNCSVPSLPAPFTASSGTPSNAQLQWTNPMSQVDTAVNTSCIANLVVYGNVTCAGGSCFLVPAGVTGARLNTHDQFLNSINFSSMAYESATISVAEQILPDNIVDVYNGMSIPASAAASHLECGTLAQLSCDEN